MNAQVGPTPQQWTEIQRVVAKFDHDWEFHSPKLEIRRKPRSWQRRAWEVIKPPAHNVFALYWWVKLHFKNYVGMGNAPFPIEHDNMPIPGYPMKYELLGGWSIPKKYWRFLRRGPLALASTGQVLVPTDAGVEKLKRVSREWGPVFVITNALLGIIGAIIKFGV